MIIELLAEMEDALRAKRKGLFQDLIRNGLFDSIILTHREIFLYFDKEKKLGKKVVQAVTNTADEFGISESSVYKIMKSMKQ